MTPTRKRLIPTAGLCLLAALALAGCATSDASLGGPESPAKASFDSPLFTRGPEILFKNGQYLAAIYPKENWSVIAADVSVDYVNGRTLVYVSKLKRGPAPPGAPQLFPLDIPGSVTPAFLQKALYWEEPDGFAHPLTVRAVP